MSILLLSSVKSALTEFTRDQWLISLEASLLPQEYRTRRRCCLLSPAREAWSGAALGGISTTDRQVSLPECVIRATPVQEENSPATASKL